MTNSPTSLNHWLAIATRGLSNDAKERIAEEVGEHISESVAELLAEGYRPGGAELEALSRLGSPRRARRGYRREYVTQREMMTLQRRQDELDKISQLGIRLHWREIYVVGAYLLIAFTNFMEGKTPELTLILSLCVFPVALETIAARVAIRLTKHQGNSRRFGMYLAMQVALAWIMAVFVTVAALQSYTFALFLFLLLLPLVTIHQYRFWKKVQPALSK